MKDQRLHIHRPVQDHRIRQNALENIKDGLQAKGGQTHKSHYAERAHHTRTVKFL